MEGEELVVGAMRFTDTVADLKLRLLALTKCQVERQRIIFNGTVREDALTLAGKFTVDFLLIT